MKVSTKVRHQLALALCTALGATMCGTAMAQADATPHSDGVGATISDTAITAKVKAKFIGEDQLKNSHIKVMTTNGVVTLTGSAPTSDSKEAAEDLAKTVDGVKSVDDQIATGNEGSGHKAVASAERAGSDAWITTKVKSELLGDSVTKGSKIHVRTNNGVVMFTGTASSDDAVTHAKDLAEKVEGVKSVDTSELKVPTG